MQASYRYGDPETAAKYPLAAEIGLPWRRRAGQVWCEIALPPCPADHIIVPSLSIRQADYRYQALLCAGGDAWPLQPVPARGRGLFNKRRRQPKHRLVSTHIDCFHTHAELPASRLVFRLRQRAEPERYLAVASVRPLQQAPQEPGTVHALRPQPPRLSQMQAPDGIRRRICSPTALAMLLQAEAPGIDWLDTVARCFDPSTNSYGCWPLAVRCAAAHGRLGAVEALPGWSAAIAVLNAGLPIVASIDFGEGELPNAPLPKTCGHLVTCYGIDGNEVLVNDPAAEDAASVGRRYDLNAFSRAWFDRRGAAYILAPR